MHKLPFYPSCWLFSLVIISLISCNISPNTIEFAEGNANELEQVLNHYTDSSAFKQRAAKFLIDNMAGHYYMASPSIAKYTKLVTSADTLTSKDMRNWWQGLKEQDYALKKFDARTLRHEFIQNNIEHAITTWQNSPWHQDINEETFLEYVLPYKVKDEPPSCIGWRDTLYNRYHYLIEGIKDIKIAYSKVYKHILKEFPIHDIGDYPYILSATDAGKMSTGRCINQSAYIVAVMRALGIPSALDQIDNWANFSTQGHSWASLIINDKTYTVNRDDSIAKINNEIDAAVFHIKDTLEKDFIYDTSFKKRVSKIWRNTYSYHSKVYDDENADFSSFSKFDNPFIEDVTDLYGYDASINICTPFNNGDSYLCTFKSGMGWQTVAHSHSNIGYYTFHNMPDSIIYIHASFDNKQKLCPLGDPFVITSVGKKTFTPDSTNLINIRVTRKYPFTLNSAKSWTQAVDATFEASNDKLFHNNDTLFMFTHTPVFRNIINVKCDKKYRYIRYRSNIKRHAYISEVEVYSGENLLKGEPYGEGFINPEACFDGDTFTFLDKVHHGSWVALDLGEPKDINKLILFPKNDGNHIVAGKTYELRCFINGEWRICSKQKSKGYELTFKDVPSNGVYWLHCVDGGNEEQVFTYENGKQIWW